jgi:hypothetical protein
MTIKDYISGKLQQFGVNVSDADLLDMLDGTDFSKDNECMGYSLNVANIAIAKFIPSLLTRATSISENGFSMSWNIEGIKEYFSILCDRYGLDNELSDKPRIDFL